MAVSGTHIYDPKRAEAASVKVNGLRLFYMGASHYETWKNVIILFHYDVQNWDSSSRLNERHYNQGPKPIMGKKLSQLKKRLMMYAQQYDIDFAGL